MQGVDQAEEIRCFVPEHTHGVGPSFVPSALAKRAHLETGVPVRKRPNATGHMRSCKGMNNLK